jgi:transaldolase
VTAAPTEQRSPLSELSLLGQSVWIDFLSRDLLTSADLQHLLVLGVSGVTTNPTVLQDAVAGRRAYDEQLRELAAAGVGADDALLELAAADVAAACDRLMDVWRRTSGRNGYVSWEVNPALAYRLRETVEEARFLAFPTQSDGRGRSGGGLDRPPS